MLAVPTRSAPKRPLRNATQPRCPQRISVHRCQRQSVAMLAYIGGFGVAVTREAWVLIEESKTGLLERDVVVVVEVVEPHDAIPASEETKRRVEADEAGCAGYEDCSWHPLPFVSSFNVAASGVPTFTSKPK